MWCDGFRLLRKWRFKKPYFFQSRWCHSGASATCCHTCPIDSFLVLSRAVSFIFRLNYPAVGT
ncbi:MAG: hypothetical protein ACI9I0_001679, partial [Rhodoferax sp.]